MMFPKANARDKKLVRQFSKEHDCCENCGALGDYASLEVAHVIDKGAGGPDIRENLIKLCGPAALQMGCHGKVHMGKISEEDLFEIVAKREGLTAKECRRRVRRKMGYNV